LGTSEADIFDDLGALAKREEIHLWIPLQPIAVRGRVIRSKPAQDNLLEPDLGEELFDAEKSKVPHFGNSKQSLDFH